MVYPQDEIGCSHKNEALTRYNVDGPQKQDAE